MKKILILTLLISSYSTVQASPVTWDIQFHNDMGLQVGDGRFTYDPATIFTATYPTGGVLCPAPHSDFDCSLNPLLFQPTLRSLEINTIFTSFNFNILGKNLNTTNTRPHLLYWTGKLISNSPDPYFFPNVESSPLLFKDKSPSGLTISSGSWTIGTKTGQESGGFIAKVSPVPLPSTFLLLGSGLISLISFSRRKSKKNHTILRY